MSQGVRIVNCILRQSLKTTLPRLPLKETITAAHFSFASPDTSQEKPNEDLARLSQDEWGIHVGEH